MLPSGRLRERESPRKPESIVYSPVFYNLPKQCHHLGTDVQTGEFLGDVFHPNDNRKLLRKRGWLGQDFRVASVWDTEKRDSMLGGKTWV